MQDAFQPPASAAEITAVLADPARKSARGRETSENKSKQESLDLELAVAAGPFLEARGTFARFAGFNDRETVLVFVEKCLGERH